MALTKNQQRALATVRGLFSGYAGLVLRVPYLDKPLDVPQCEIAVRCAGFGEVLQVEIAIRESGGTGWAPETRGTWTGRERRFQWECTARGKARWIGVAPAVVLRAAAQ